MPLQSFRHATPSLRLYYSEDCLGQLSAEMRRLGRRRALIVCGPTLGRSELGAPLVKATLGELCVGAFEGVAEHSPLPSVLAAVDMLRRTKADAVIALGGGSAVVTARAATILHGEDKDVAALCTQFPPGQPPVSPRLAAPKLPQFLIPTTPTTACPRAGAAVLDPNLGKRLSLFDPKARPEAIFYHPALFSAAPAGLVLDAGLNAFTMAIQGLESPRRDPIAEGMLLHAARLMFRRLPDHGSASPEVRGDLMLAALLSGQGTDFTGLGLAAALGHAVGARFAVGNGLVNAIVLPHTLRFNAPATMDSLHEAPDSLGLPADAAGVSPVERVAQACLALFERLGLPLRLRDLGLDRQVLGQIAQDMEGDWFVSQNPRKASHQDLLALLDAAW